MFVQDGEVKADRSRDIAKVAVIERHRNTGRVQIGLVNGFCFNESCAVASTVAHDSHQLIVVGTDDEDMALMDLSFSSASDWFDGERGEDAVN